MPKPSVSVQVFDEYRGLLSERWLRVVVERTLSLETDRLSLPIGVVVADDDTVRGLNKRHRGLDENTDVLSFSFDHSGEYYGDAPEPSNGAVEFVTAPDWSSGLGEVVISYPQARRQALESGRDTALEVAHLLAHGVLHLLGYDHMAPEEEAAMRAREAEVLARTVDDAWTVDDD